jgi:hypothetical protein
VPAEVVDLHVVVQRHLHDRAMMYRLRETLIQRDFGANLGPRGCELRCTSRLRHAHSGVALTSACDALSVVFPSRFFVTESVWWVAAVTKGNDR